MKRLSEKRIILTGSPCRKGEDHFTEELSGLLRSLIQETPGVPRRGHLVSAAPDAPRYCRSVFDSTVECFRRSGFCAFVFHMLERSNAAAARDLVMSSDIVMLCGGHVPTQNRFFRQIGLKDILKDYRGIVIGCSAGSMNCADRVYSHPELRGESADPSYRRWLRGLGLTDINLLPHLEDIGNATLDGRRLIEDICLPDSFGRRFVTFRDGVFIDIDPAAGHNTIHGESFIVTDGSVRKYTGTMNFVFISPHFPASYALFCRGLHSNGVNVFAIADCPYESLSGELRSSITEYYKVGSLENYDEVYRAVAYFASKYGRIDWIESNNEYWLEQDARLRTDFNVTSGIRTDHISAIKNKSEMKKYYALGGVPTSRQIKACEGRRAVLKFAASTGYPIIAKPDNGVGADGTFKICCEQELHAFFDSHPDNYGAFVVEEFVTGLLVSYDAVYNSASEPVFESMSVFPTPIMEVVHHNLECCYWVEKKVPAALRDAGRRTVKAFGIKSRFVHCEFFKLDRDRKGLGRKGDYVGLEVNMRPAGGVTPDMMNYAHSTDVFRIWADMVAFDECRTPQGEQYVCVYASRRDAVAYKHSDSEIRERYGSAIATSGRMAAALSGALGNDYFILRLQDVRGAKECISFITAHE